VAPHNSGQPAFRHPVVCWFMFVGFGAAGPWGLRFGLCLLLFGFWSACPKPPFRFRFGSAALIERTSKAPVSTWHWVRSGPVHIVLLRARLVGKMGSDHIHIYIHTYIYVIYIYIYIWPALCHGHLFCTCSGHCIRKRHVQRHPSADRSSKKASYRIRRSKGHLRHVKQTLSWVGLMGGF
jgi:hypothetical protein